MIHLIVMWKNDHFPSRVITNISSFLFVTLAILLNIN